MSIWTCLKRGFLFTLKPQNLVMLGLLLVVQALAALLMISPLVPTLEESVVATPDQTTEVSLGTITPWMLVELHAKTPPGAKAGLGLGLIVFMLINTFHSAGILSVMRTTDGKFRFPRFFSGGGVYFLRFARLLILLGTALFVFNWLVMELLDPLIQEYGEDSRNERSVFYLDLVRQFFVLSSVACLVMVFEYARIRTVVLEKRSMILTTFASIGFVLRRPIRTFSIFTVTFLLDMAVVGSFALLFILFPVTNAKMIGLHLLLTVFLAYLRVGVRVVRLASEAAFFMENVGSVSGDGRELGPRSKPRDDDESYDMVPSGAAVPFHTEKTFGPSSSADEGVTARELEGADLRRSHGVRPAPVLVAPIEKDPPRKKPENQDLDVPQVVLPQEEPPASVPTVPDEPAEEPVLPSDKKPVEPDEPEAWDEFQRDVSKERRADQPPSEEPPPWAVESDPFNEDLPKK